ncbi:BTAD domain-containing putative transcriptional regulator [soil metagenome]
MKADTYEVADPAGADNSPPSLRVELFRGFRVKFGDRYIPDANWRTQKARSLVKLLCLAQAHRLHREELMDLLWPELEAKAAANNLRVTLHAARRALNPSRSPGTQSVLHLGDNVIVLDAGDAGDALCIDVDVFQFAAASARQNQDPGSYQTAIDLYTGDLLPEDRYEDWATGPRERLRATYLGLLAGLAHLLEARGAAEQAIVVLQRLVVEEPTDEEANVGLMRHYASTGQRRLALRQYQRLRAILREELDVEPDPDTQGLYAAILSGRFPTESSSQAIAFSPARRHDLPAPLTSFIGRERALASITKLLTGTRMITLTGVGGSGKTRLALTVAHGLAERMDEYPHGVSLVELSALVDPELVPTAIAQALGIPPQSGRSPLDTLTEALRDKQLLLLMDNCEHLIDTCAQVIAELLAVCPSLHVLATSREVLHAPGELVWRVPPMAFPEELPGSGQALDEEQLLNYESVRLFYERAKFVQPEFSLTSQNAAAVVQICQRLDGLPLAIELAAVRVGILSPQQIAARLDMALEFLQGGGRAVSARQQTMRGTLDWSYDLLSEPERRLLERLAVFAGGWMLDAAERIGAGGVVAVNDVLELLAQLVDKSLVVTRLGPGGDVRYAFLEPVRQYAKEWLAACDDVDKIYQRHAEFYMAIAEQVEAGLNGPAQAEWLERVETEHDNIRAALAWALERDNELGDQLATAMWRFWYMRGHLREGRGWLTRALSLIETLQPPLRAEVFRAAGSLAWCDGDYEDAHALSEQALALFRSLGDTRGIRDTLTVLGTTFINQGKYEQGKRYHEESLELEREAGDAWGISRSLGSIAELMFYQGDYETAHRYWVESLAINRELKDTWGVAITLNNIGEILRSQGNLERAYEQFAESMTLFQELDFKHGIAAARSNLAEIHLEWNQYDDAERLLHEVLEISRDLDHPAVIANVLEITAKLAAIRGQTERAAQLFGAADALREHLGIPLTPTERAKLEPWINIPCPEHSEVLQQAWSDGRKMSVDQALDYACEMRSQPTAPPVAPLTPREREIVELVSTGLTNQQIAAQLSISTRTADTHVSNVLRKLGLASRSAIREWAIEHQLLPDASSSGS